ncbi:hypothetical protein PO909_024030 [Leuciscus waleckii]
MWQVHYNIMVVLDLTFGAGGHSKAILLSVPDVMVVAADRDPIAFQMAQRLAEEYPIQAFCRPIIVFQLTSETRNSVTNM